MNEQQWQGENVRDALREIVKHSRPLFWEDFEAIYNALQENLPKAEKLDVAVDTALSNQQEKLL